MNTKTALSDEQKRYAAAVESALSILLSYEEDGYEFLADEAVVSDLIENHSYSISDAHAILVEASAIHETRQLAGSCNQESLPNDGAAIHSKHYLSSNKMNTSISKCPCCNDRILAIHGDCIKSSSVPSELIPVADLTLCNLRILMQQISEHLSEA
jgi:hypothetical protein